MALAVAQAAVGERGVRGREDSQVWGLREELAVRGNMKITPQSEVVCSRYTVLCLLDVLRVRRYEGTTRLYLVPCKAQGQY